jgi:hypothetical protein
MENLKGEKQSVTHKTNNKIADAWREALKKKGYEPTLVTRWSCIRLAILSRKWRRSLAVRCLAGSLLYAFWSSDVVAVLS